MHLDLLEVTPPATIMLISDHVESVFIHVLCQQQQQEHVFNLVLAYTYASIKASVLVTSAEWLCENLLTGVCPLITTKLS